MTRLLKKRWNGVAIVLLSSFFFAFVPTSAKIALDSGVSLMVLLISRCIIGLIILAPLTKSLGHTIFVDKNKVATLIFVSVISVCLIASTYHAFEYISIALVLMIIYLFPIGGSSYHNNQRRRKVGTNSMVLHHRRFIRSWDFNFR